jgi:hypothetical protein
MSRVLESNPTWHLGHVGLGPTKSQADHYKLAWRGPATFPSPHVIPPRGRTYPPSRARAEPDSAARHDSDTDSPGKENPAPQGEPLYRSSAASAFLFFVLSSFLPFSRCAALESRRQAGGVTGEQNITRREDGGGVRDGSVCGDAEGIVALVAGGPRRLRPDAAAEPPGADQRGPTAVLRRPLAQRALALRGGRLGRRGHDDRELREHVLPRRRAAVAVRHAGVVHTALVRAPPARRRGLGRAPPVHRVLPRPTARHHRRRRPLRWGGAQLRPGNARQRRVVVGLFFFEDCCWP